jgi:hypothetical protein
MKPVLVRLQPVGYPIYRDLSELNRLMEEVIAVFGRLAKFRFLHRDDLKAHQVMVEEVRAAVNETVMEILRAREFNNAAYYEDRRLAWQTRFKDPLLDARRRNPQSVSAKKRAAAPRAKATQK